MHSNAWDGLTGPPFAFRNYAHVYAPTAVTDTADWTLIEGDFTADSAYAYIVLGNFFDDAHTTGVSITGATPYVVYYLIDGVEVIPNDPACHSVGIGERETERGPRVTTSDNGLLIHWPGRVIQEVMLVDGRGRLLAQEQGERSEYAHLPQPTCSGAYFVRVRDDREQVVVKFVKVE
jgi:hypothetical protein